MQCIHIQRRRETVTQIITTHNHTHTHNKHTYIITTHNHAHTYIHSFIHTHMNCISEKNEP
eukprot:m.161425 g.161425  ORF g.161425 m.161425 type:complete len:61 (+) comp13401_c0_seq3:2663-2845(+)